MMLPNRHVLFGNGLVQIIERLFLHDDVIKWKHKGWANNRDAGDLRRHDAYYDVTVMNGFFFGQQAYKPWNHKRKIMIIIFPHKDNT